MEKKSVYIETTIPSYATAKPSRDLIKAARQSITLLFWENARQNYDLYISQYVIDECAKGDAAQRRLTFIDDIPLLETSEKTEQLALNYQQLLKIPDDAKIDCFHLAVCVETKMDYLLSWNCTHLGVNAYAKVRGYNERHGLWTPLLITPEALIELSGEEQE